MKKIIPPFGLIQRTTIVRCLFERNSTSNITTYRNSPKIHLDISPKSLIERKYCNVSISCWNCHKTVPNSDIFCLKCGSLQKLNEKHNYFTLLGLTKKYDLDNTTLTNKFRELQSVLHPDKYSNKTEMEQSISLEWSSQINKAYTTLSAPIKRGEYLLKQNGFDLPQDNSSLDKKFLMEMMERNEEVEEAKTPNDIKILLSTVREELKNYSRELEIIFKNNKFLEAISIIVKMKYLLSIENSLKAKARQLGIVE